MTVEPIGDTFRRLRNASGLSLRHFADRYGVTAITMGSYERGDRKPSVERAREILACFGHDLIAVPRNADRPDVDAIVEYGVAWHDGTEECHIECDEYDEAELLAAVLVGGRVVSRTRHVGPWTEVAP